MLWILIACPSPWKTIRLYQIGQYNINRVLDVPIKQNNRNVVGSVFLLGFFLVEQHAP